LKKIVIFICLFWMGFIFYMSSNNGQISQLQSNKVTNIVEDTESKLKVEYKNKYELEHIIRKNAHMFMYMILAFLVSSSFFIYNKKGKNVVIYILFICLFYAVTDEFHQFFVPGRTSLVSDVLIDFGGTVIGLIVFYISYYSIYSIKKRKFKSTKFNI
jgi:VanZ family protein